MTMRFGRNGPERGEHLAEYPIRLRRSLLLVLLAGRRSPAAAAASVASFSDINGSFACRIKYRSFCDSARRSPRLTSASSSSFLSFLPSTVNSGVLYVAAFTVNSSEVMSANRVRPFFISEPGLKWMGVGNSSVLALENL
jgi:hypothetical protein